MVRFAATPREGADLANTITPEVFRFYRSIARNNDREWFARNKERFHEEVRDPILAFIEVIGPRLRAISPKIVADPRPVGGSLFRIYRDTRFSKDKRPYKTYAGMSFRTAAKNAEAPGFYLHLEPGRVFSGVGLWHPSTAAQKAVRAAIVDDPAGWKRLRRVGLDEGNPLLRPPRGFDPDHPLIEDLKRRSFTASTEFTEKQACAPDFPARFVRACKRAAPLVSFLSGAVGQRF